MTTAHPPSDALEGKGAAARPAADPPDSPRKIPWWGRPWLLLSALFVAGLITFLPSLTSPFLLDDYLHVAMVDGTFPSPRGPLQLYDFVSDADRSLLVERGVLPWWTHPQLTIRFFRPISSALLWANHRLFGAHAFALHVHSLLWWCLAVVAVRTLYRRAFSPRVVAMSTVIFALAPCHAIPLAWLANFEVLVSLTLGAFALVCHVRWRQEGSVRAAFASMLLFGIALLAGEYALCFAGYVFAIELVRRDGLLRRALGPLPFVAPAMVYLIVRAAGKYGSFGSGFYTDPFRDPSTFVRSAPWRFVALLADGWLTADADTWGPNARRWVIVLVVVVGAALLVVPVRRTLARLQEPARSTATWMLVGSLLSLLPVLAVQPSPRVLGISCIGLVPVVACIIDHAWFAPASPPGVKEPRGAMELTGLVALALAFMHFVHGPATAWLLGREMRRTAVEFRAHARWLHRRIPDPAVADVFVVRGLGGMFFAPFAIDPHAQPPARWRILAQTGHVLVLRRDPRTLELVVPPDQSLTTTGASNLFRNARDPLHVGDSIRVPGMRATVLEVGAQGPIRVRYDFDEDMESPGETWIVESLDGFHDAKLPPLGFGAPFEP